MVMREMVDASVLDLVRQGLAAERISLHVGYARKRGAMRRSEVVFEGEHGKRFADGRFGAGAESISRKLAHPTNSFKQLVARFEELFDETVDPQRAVRRISIGFSDLAPECLATPSLFADIEGEQTERDLQDAVLAVKERFGKNALLRGTSFKEKATARERNNQIGGHRA